MDNNEYKVSYVSNPCTFSNIDFWKYMGNEPIKINSNEIPFRSSDQIGKNPKEEKTMKKNLKLVQWFIVDANEHLPEDKAILGQGISLMRDEREFLINLGIPKMLEHHNIYRTTVEYEQPIGEGIVTRKLKEANIRDLEIIINIIKEF